MSGCVLTLHKMHVNGVQQYDRPVSIYHRQTVVEYTDIVGTYALCTFAICATRTKTILPNP